MAIGRTIHESMQKALRGLETGLSGFNFVDRLVGASHEQLKSELAQRTPDRLLIAAQAIREGVSLAEINRIAGYDMWFLDRIAEIVEAENGVLENGLPRDAEGLRRLKAMGFSDKRLAYLALQSAHLRRGARQRADPRGREGDDRRRHRRRGACAAPQARRAAGVQDHRHLRRRIRRQNALSLFDL
jgi:hypothetical protein